jgi:hypothetical protein
MKRIFHTSVVYLQYACNTNYSEVQCVPIVPQPEVVCND